MLTYRSNASGTLLAAYLGDVRVGYVERRQFGRVLWQNSIVLGRPDLVAGREDTVEAAQEALADSVRWWIEAAGLVVRGESDVTRGERRPDARSEDRARALEEESADRCHGVDVDRPEVRPCEGVRGTG